MMETKYPRATKDIQESTTQRISTGCGTMYLTICKDKAGITDLIIKLGKSGGCASAQAECLAALLSTALKAGVDPQSLIKDLIGVRCSEALHQAGEDVLSCGDAVGKFLKHFLKANCQKNQASKEMGEPDKDELNLIDHAGGDEDNTAFKEASSE